MPSAAQLMAKAADLQTSSADGVCATMQLSTKWWSISFSMKEAQKTLSINSYDTEHTPMERLEAYAEKPIDWSAIQPRPF